MFFTFAGAYLIEKHHGLPATPKVGAAFYSLGGTPLPNIIAFARPTTGGIGSDLDGFHCWVECGGWAIDFMSPIFQDGIPPSRGFVVPPRMFQRPLQTMARSYRNEDLASPGDFFLEHNPSLVEPILGANLARLEFRKLVEICQHWYRPSPEPMPPTFVVRGNNGTQKELTLRLPTLVGAW